MYSKSVQKEDFLNGVLWKQVLYVFFPILFGSFFQQLYTTVDAIIVGQYLGKQALAAVGGSTGNILNLLISFFVGLSSGAGIIIAQQYGAKHYRAIRKSVHTAMALAFVGGFIFTVFGILDVVIGIASGADCLCLQCLQWPGVAHLVGDHPFDVALQI